MESIENHIIAHERAMIAASTWIRVARGLRVEANRQLALLPTEFIKVISRQWDDLDLHPLEMRD